MTPRDDGAFVMLKKPMVLKDVYIYWAVWTVRII